MSHFPAWWLVWLVVIVVFAVVRGVFVRKASARRERERRERPARQSRPELRRAGIAHQSPPRADGQPLVTRDQLIAAGAIIPAAEPDPLPTDLIA